jgi:hypothetical protein
MTTTIHMKVNDLQVIGLYLQVFVSCYVNALVILHMEMT